MCNKLRIINKKCRDIPKVVTASGLCTSSVDQPTGMNIMLTLQEICRYSSNSGSFHKVALGKSRVVIYVEFDNA